MATPTDVVFYIDRETIHISENLVCTYDVLETVDIDSWDYLGIYPVGWQSLNSYVTYEYVTVPEGYVKGKKASCTNTFYAKHLPKDEDQYYQICYISRKHGVRGASAPFQFRSSLDRDFIEQECEGMMVVRPRIEVMQDEIQSLGHKVMLLNNERDALQSKLHITENLLAVRDQHLTQLQTEIDALAEAEGVEKEKSKQLRQELEIYQAELKKLIKGKEEVKETLEKERQKVKELQDQMSHLQASISVMQSDKDELSGQNQSLIDELNIYKVQVMDSQTLVTQSSKTIEKLNQSLEMAFNESATYVEECEELKKKNYQDERMLARLNAQLAQVMQQKEEAETKHNDLLHELQNANDKLLACDTMKAKLSRDLEAYEMTQDKLNSTFMLQEAENRSLREKLEQQCKERSAAMADLVKTKEKLQHTEETLNHTLKSTQTHNDQLKHIEEKYTELKDRYDDTKKRLGMISAQMATVSDEKKAMQIQLRSFEEELKTTLNLKDMEVGELRDMLKKQEEALHDKEEELARTQFSYEQACQRCEELSEELQRMAQSLQEASIVEKELVAQQAVLDDELKDLKKDRESYAKDMRREEEVRRQDTIREMAAVIEDRDKEVADLKQRLEMGRIEFTHKALENERLAQRLQMIKSSELVEGACADPAVPPVSEKEKVDEEKAKKYKRLYKMVKKEEESLQGLVALLKKEVASLEDDNSRLAEEVVQLREEAMLHKIHREVAALEEKEKPAAEEEVEDDDEEEEEETAESAQLIYGNPYATKTGAADEVEEDKASRSSSSILSTLEEEACASGGPLMTQAAGKEDQLPPPLQPQVLTSSSTTSASDSSPEEAAAEEGSHEVFEDCPAMPLVDERFMDAIGEGMKICPFCQASIMASSDFEEHVATHFGRICPVCRKQADDGMSPEDFEQHVNKCLDQDSAAGSEDLE